MNHLCNHNEYYKSLFEFVKNKGNGFLVKGKIFEDICEHDWENINHHASCCIYCGKLHVCSEHNCPLIETDNFCKVCKISGCVVRNYEYREERNFFDRVAGYFNSNRDNLPQEDNEVENHYVEIGTQVEKKKKRGRKQNANKIVEKAQKRKRSKLIDTFFKNVKDNELNLANEEMKNQSVILSVFDNNASKFNETIYNVVHEILHSEKTEVCYIEEVQRNEIKIISLMNKLLKEISTLPEKKCPCILSVFTEIFYSFRKSRLTHQKKSLIVHKFISTLEKTCTESISNVLLRYGGPRVARQMQSSLRCKEFICSMLYLMRMGITYQNRQLLPKIDVLNEYLPLQVLLPCVFNIRAKSITEGENIIKLDIRKMPWI